MVRRLASAPPPPARPASQATRLRRRALSATTAAPKQASTQVEGSGTITNWLEAGLKTMYCPLEVSGVHQLPRWLPDDWPPLLLQQ